MDREGQGANEGQRADVRAGQRSQEPCEARDDDQGPDAAPWASRPCDQPGSDERPARREVGERGRARPYTAHPLGQDSEHDGANADGQTDAAAPQDPLSRYGPVADDSRAQPHDVIVARQVDGPEPGREPCGPRSGAFSSH